MKKLKLFLTVMMICLVIPSEAQTKNSTQHDYYIYSWIQVRGANKANGDPCFVILMSSGNGTNSKPSILKNEVGRTVVFNSQIDGLNYLTLQGWELFEPRTEARISNWVARKKVSREVLAQSVNSNTFYLEETPKIQLDLAEQAAHITYE
ncbi:hypothetical protein [Segatella baroniae]|uniref:hypothetical protein n=1 Tax=Segatella baroniae TaxID=305719 RepID=UPI00046EB9B9|nr:hypothetical protein [Segatella baroniae]